MTKQELAEMRARAEAATPPPWKAHCTGPEDRDWSVDRVAMMEQECGAIRNERDATFIAHAREDVPSLLAEIDRLHKLLQDTLPWIDVLHNYYSTMEELPGYWVREENLDVLDLFKLSEALDRELHPEHYDQLARRIPWSEADGA